MFGKLKEKLKAWTKKVSKEDEVLGKKVKDKKKDKGKKSKSEKKTSEIVEETKILEEDIKIEEKLKETLKKGKYLEAKKSFNEGMQTFIPDAQETKEEEITETPAPLGVPQNTELGDKKKKSSFFKKLTSRKIIISNEDFDEYAQDLEFLLLENNVALEVVEKMIENLKEKITQKELSKKEIEQEIKDSLKEIIQEVLIEPFNLIKKIKEKDEPYVILFCGINGSGKTTSVAKFAHLLKKEKISCVMAAADTFRAAAIDQIKKHGQNLDIKVIAQEYGTDPAAVGFDAIKYAKKNKIGCVLIDTAGRIHTAKNLMNEIQKINKVCNPDTKIFVGESITGNDAVEQVKAFDEAINLDGIILSKADIDEKGGTALSVGYITKKPILYLGTGQEYENLEKFDKSKFIEKLGL